MDPVYGGGYPPPASYGGACGPPASYGAPAGFSGGYAPAADYGHYGPPVVDGSRGPPPEYGPHGPPPDYSHPPLVEYGHAPPSDYGHPPRDYSHHPPHDYQHLPPAASAWGPSYAAPPEYGAGYGYGAYSTAYGSHGYGPYGGYAAADYGAANGYASPYAGHGYYGAAPGYAYYGPPAGYGYGPVVGYGPQVPYGGHGASSGGSSHEGGRKRAANRAGREGGEPRNKCAKSSSSSAGGSRRSAPAGGGEPQPSQNLHVAGLPGGMAPDALKQLFTAHGKVVLCRVLGGPTSDGKCAAIVRFESLEEAKLVKEKVSGTVLNGLKDPVTVRFANSAESKVAKGGNEVKGMGKGHFHIGPISVDTLTHSFETNGALPGCRGHDGNQHALYIAGLPPDTCNVHLYKLFASFGAIRPKGVHAMMNPDGTCRGIAFVNFLDETSAQAAILMYNGAVLPDGTTLKVAMKQPKSDAAKTDAAKSAAALSAAVAKSAAK